jgi:tetratricopeptide (TPR) repeat protein
MLCADANFQLGYLIIAEQMYAKCLAYRDYECDSFRKLGDLASR